MSSVQAQEALEKTNRFIQVDEAEVRSHVGELVRQSVETTLNGLLDAEAEEACGAKRYQRSVERVDTRAGHYTRTLETQAGPVKLRVPRLRNLPLETEIIGALPAGVKNLLKRGRGVWPGSSTAAKPGVATPPARRGAPVP